MGGSVLKASVAAAIVVCIWIYNVAFNIPMFMWADVRIRQSGRSGCSPNFNRIYTLIARIINLYVPLIITWTSYIGIIYKMRSSVNKVRLPVEPRLSLLLMLPRQRSTSLHKPSGA